MKILSNILFTSILSFLLGNSVIQANNLKVGDKVLNFKANDGKGDLWELQENLNQKYLIVYFYPIAFTGG
jgi:hypothetical protein